MTVIHYTQTDGIEQTAELKYNWLELRLKGIAEIDLSPISNMEEQLTGLNLGMNSLKHIDLSPISCNSEFKALELYSNRFEKIDLFPLSTCAGFEKLDLQSNDFRQIDLSPLSSCKNLLSLNLKLNNLESIDLSPLEDCKKLVRIDLSSNSIKSIQLFEWPNLEHLILYGNEIGKIDLSPIACAHNLETIHLVTNNLKEIDLSPLTECVNLRKIDLRRNPLPSVDTSPLEDLQFSNHLQIKYDGKELGKGMKTVTIKWRGEGKNKSIRYPLGARSLMLDNMEIDEIDFSQIRSLRDLTRINLDNNKLEELDLSVLEDFPELKWLRLSHNNIQELDLEHISQCKSLQVLDISYNGIQDLDLTPLAECKNLEKLFISNNSLLEIVGLKPLGECLQLTDLYAANCGGLGDSFSPSLFSKHANMTRLDLSGNCLVECDLSLLGSKPNLKMLKLGSNKLQSIDLNPIKEFQHLEYLDLSYNPLLELDLSPLSTNTMMSELSLLGVPLEQIDISPLYYIFGGQRINLFRISDDPFVERTTDNSSPAGTGRKKTWYLEGERESYGNPVFTNFILLVDKSMRIVLDENLSEGLWLEERDGIESSVYERIERIPIEDLKSFTATKGIQTFGEIWKELGHFPLEMAYSKLGISYLWTIREKIIDFAKRVDPDLTVVEGISKLVSISVDYLAEEIENGRSTYDLDVDNLSKSQAVTLVPIILEARKAEIERVKLEVYEDRIYAMELYRTFYGRKIMQQVKINPYEVSIDELVLIRDHFAKMGIKLTIPEIG